MTEEVRAYSETGAAKGRKLARYDLIPTYPLRLLAEAYGKGLEKYPTEPGELDNWRRGYNWSDSYAALQRHLNAFWSGEDYDPETGNHHLISAVFHAFSLVEWGRHPELVELYDDRQDSDPEPESFIDWSTVKPLPDGIYTMEFAAEGVSPELLRYFYGDIEPNDDDGPDFERDYNKDADEPNCSVSKPCQWCRDNLGHSFYDPAYDGNEDAGPVEGTMQDYMDQVDAMAYALASVTALPVVAQQEDYSCRLRPTEEPCVACWPELEDNPESFDEGPRTKTGGW